MITYTTLHIILYDLKKELHPESTGYSPNEPCWPFFEDVTSSYYIILAKKYNELDLQHQVSKIKVVL